MQERINVVFYDREDLASKVSGFEEQETRRFAATESILSEQLADCEAITFRDLGAKTIMLPDDLPAQETAEHYRDQFIQNGQPSYAQAAYTAILEAFQARAASAH